jgi:hypothetical protein
MSQPRFESGISRREARSITALVTLFEVEGKDKPIPVTGRGGP